MQQTRNKRAAGKRAPAKGGRGRRSGGIVLHKQHPAVAGGVTLFPTLVREPGASGHNILKTGHYNTKLGKRVTRGRFEGYDLFSLTLEERATCPTSCYHWRSCYGNNMPFAHRFRDGDALVERLALELAELDERYSILNHKRRGRGALIRLHVLGDFYSVPYVDAWGRFLDELPRIAVFGFTAWPYRSVMGRALLGLRDRHPDRFALRFSVPRAAAGRMEAVPELPTLFREGQTNTFPCPAQRADHVYCSTCAACWENDKSVSFSEH